jgi:hypothetical protein
MVSRSLVRVIAIASGVALAVAAAGQAARDSVPTGTWSGTIGIVGAPRGFYRPRARLTVSASALRAEYSGLAGRSRDPSNRSSCVSDYRFSRVEKAWRYYRQSGTAQYGANGFVKNAPCVVKRGTLLRIAPAGTKLAVEVALTPKTGTFAADYRTFLHR